MDERKWPWKVTGVQLARFVRLQPDAVLSQKFTEDPLQCPADRRVQSVISITGVSVGCLGFPFSLVGVMARDQ